MYEQLDDLLGTDSDTTSDDAESTPETQYSADAAMTEAERRLAKAPYYRAIVSTPLIQDDGTDVAEEINKEISDFARRRMMELLGVGTPAPEVPVVELPFTPEQIEGLKALLDAFTPNEIRALKVVAAKLLASAGQRPVDPVVKPVQLAVATPKITAPAVAPAPASKKPPAKASQAPARPKQKKPAPPPPKPQQTQAQPGVLQRVEDMAYEDIPLGQVFRDIDGKLYKRVGNPNYDPDRQGSKAWSKILVQVQVGNAARLPMPTGSALEAVTASQAQQTLALSAPGNTAFPDATDGRATMALLGAR